MDPVDQTKLANHLNAGKKLYIEGTDVGYNLFQTDFYRQMFGAQYLGDGTKIKSLSGQNGSLAAGKNHAGLLYYPDTMVNAFNDEIQPRGGTGSKLLFKCDMGQGRALCKENPDKKYKVIYATFMFGIIRGIPEKNALMKIYMEWLVGGPTGITQEQLSHATDNLFSANGSGDRIDFTLARPARLSINLYTVAGRLVGQRVEGSFGEGSHRCRIGADAGSGKYILRIQADDRAIARTLFIWK